MSHSSNESVERTPAQRLMFGAIPTSRDLRIVGNGVEMNHSLRARNAGLDVTPSFLSLFKSVNSALLSRRDLDHNAAPSQHVINNGYRGMDPRRMPRLYPAHAPSTLAQTIQDCIDRVLGIEAARVHTTPMPPVLRGNRRGPMYGDLISHSLNRSPPLSAKQKAEQEQGKRVKKSEKRREKQMKRKEKREKKK
ncbi:hypothetical protein E4T47_03007 [Aureobasidium subglaciale]|nr:hypothetical protein E4T47_03007 [Aureobasidium subglaciale]